MSWFAKLLPSRIRTETGQKKGVPEGLWTKCKACNAVLYRAELSRSIEVCPKCGHHHRIDVRTRIKAFLDVGNQVEIGADLEPIDKLKFRDSKKYKDRISAAQKSTGEKEAIVVIQGQLMNMPVVVCCFNFEFMGGSMSASVGEKFVLGANAAIEQACPLICFSASGGARMQEGLSSLMQMARTSAALGKLAKANLPYISVLTDPTMGGVTASLAMLGDIIIAEPDALIGFAGPRVIEQTVRQTLPEGFQRSNFLLTHGHIDMIVDRRKMRVKIAQLLAKFMSKSEIFSMPEFSLDVSGEDHNELMAEQL